MKANRHSNMDTFQVDTNIFIQDCAIDYTLPTDQLFNLEFQFESVFNLEFQPKFGIQLEIPI